jgi:hypothetical protein
LNYFDREIQHKKLHSYDIMNQFIDSFVDGMIMIHNKFQVAEPTSESYPDFDLCM